MVLLGWIVVDKSYWLKPEQWVCNQLLSHEFRGIACTDDQRWPTRIGPPAARILQANCSGKEPGKGYRSGCQECIDKNDREWNARGTDLTTWHDPDSDGGREDRRDSTGHQDLPQFTDAGVAPQAPIHAQIVEDEQANWPPEPNVRQNQP